MITEKDINLYLSNKDTRDGFRIRNITRNAIHVGSSELTLGQLSEVSTLIESLSTLSNPEELYPKYLRALRGTKKYHRPPNYVWGDLAFGLLRRILEQNNIYLTRDQLLSTAEPILKEVRFSIGSVRSVFPKDHRKLNFVEEFGNITDPETKDSFEIKGVCPFPQTARKWIVAYDQVIEKAVNEHPELF